MQVPPDLARDGEVLDATDRTTLSGDLIDESFRLGPYAVTDVHRQGTSSEQFELTLAGGDDTARAYEYTLLQGKTALKGGCRTAEVGSSASTGNEAASSQRVKKLACSCASATTQATLSMEDRGGTFEGTITTSAGRHRLASVHELEGGASQNEPSGYRVDGNGKVFAVDVTPPGRVWLGKSLVENERHELACLFVGLMLYEPPEE